MVLNKSEEFLSSHEFSNVKTYEHIRLLEVTVKQKIYRVLTGKKDGEFVCLFSKKYFDPEVEKKILNHLNHPHKGFHTQEVKISINKKNREIIGSMIHSTRTVIEEILQIDHITQSVNHSHFEAESLKGVEYQSSHELYEYTANNRKKFYVVFDINGNVVEVVAKNGPMSFVTQMQKNHIQQKWQDQEKNRFEKIEKSSKTNALISQIENKIRLKQLGHIKHPEISGEYIYTNSKGEDLVVIVENGKVVSLLPNEVSPQQKGAIQKKLNLLGEEAFHAKVQAMSLQDLVEGDDEKLLCPYKNEFSQLFEIIKNYDPFLISDQYTIEDKKILIQDIFAIISKNFTEYEIIGEPKKALNKSYVRFQQFLQKTGQRYPFLKQETQYIAQMMNTIRDLLIK